MEAQSLCMYRVSLAEEIKRVNVDKKNRSSAANPALL